MCCTGHNFLRKQRFLQKRRAVSKCRLCEYEEESSLSITDVINWVTFTDNLDCYYYIKIQLFQFLT